MVSELRGQNGVRAQGPEWCPSSGARVVSELRGQNQGPRVVSELRGPEWCPSSGAQNGVRAQGPEWCPSSGARVVSELRGQSGVRAQGPEWCPSSGARVVSELRGQSGVRAQGPEWCPSSGARVVSELRGQSGVRAQGPEWCPSSGARVVSELRGQSGVRAQGPEAKMTLLKLKQRVSEGDNRSMDFPLAFKSPSDPTCDSLHDKSTKLLKPLNSGSPEDDPRYHILNDSRSKLPQTELDAVFKCLEEDIVRFVLKQLQWHYRLLASDYPECSESESEQSSREAVLNITLDFLKRMDQEHLADRLRNKSVAPAGCNLKSQLRRRFGRVFEGVAKTGDSASLAQIYTSLYITEGGASEVNQEHEVRLMESASRTPATPEKTITCEDIFKARPHSPEPIRALLTKGVAGVGKTVLTQKFSLDWAEGGAHQELQLLFPFTFRELNVLRDTPFSLVELLHHFFSPSKDLCSFQQLQVLFIFDGLDECRPPLDFSRTRVLSDPTESVSVDVLLVNLIRGSLLPSARLWITTRPAAANQIPEWCVSMVTEVRGFTDPQKEVYFRKRFRDKAKTVISHIKSIRSLHIMCHIPVFCWILSTVIQKLLKQTESPELPRTLTQMYVHFLVVQAKVQNIKFHQRSWEDHHWTPETREMVQSLGKLAFEQLQKGNLIFYESDLSECGLDAAAASVYSGVFTQVFREESALHQVKVYCFIHLSVQEFLAALHVHQTFSESEKIFHSSAVDQALQSPNGHLDMFLRFLLGLSLPTNQRLLQGLLTQTGSDRTNQDTVKYIKQKLNEEGLSAERSLNLLHCLNELNDRSLVEEIQKKMREGQLSHRDMSPADWTAMTFLLLSSDSDLEEFDLRNYNPSEEALLRLLPVIKVSNKAILSCCGLTPQSCGLLASVLSTSSFKHLDLSNNDLQDSGVELLCDGLKSAPCSLETLRLSGCLVSERGGAALALALCSAHFHLRKLDLSYNHPGPTAEKLTALRDDPHCPLQSVRLEPAGEKWLTPGLTKYFIELSLDPDTANRKLRLSENNCTATYVDQDQPYPDEQQRFDFCPQVLGTSKLMGRCYWEVDFDLRPNGSVYIALSCNGILTKKDEKNCEFGANRGSWALKISRGSYGVAHGGRVSTIPYTPLLYRSPNASRSTASYIGRVAVYLDFAGGSISFYEASFDKLILLHSFHTRFSEPLFAGFRVQKGSVSLVSKE
ncbi:NLR family CARD domain-containing protein 3-like [Eucyclogobius newberryi]|uniref:NLR family CARD domain-containing protein 3-like n=1 Tax=Eucyclogobius newberryi TaxID=166745 RepID=UPI003B5B4A41